MCFVSYYLLNYYVWITVKNNTPVYVGCKFLNWKKIKKFNKDWVLPVKSIGTRLGLDIIKYTKLCTIIIIIIIVMRGKKRYLYKEKNNLKKWKNDEKLNL